MIVQFHSIKLIGHRRNIPLQQGSPKMKHGNQKIPLLDIKTEDRAISNQVVVKSSSGQGNDSLENLFHVDIFLEGSLCLAAQIDTLWGCWQSRLVLIMENPRGRL